MKITLPPQLQSDDLRRFFAAMQPAECKLVGGCVRDALTNTAKDDVDIDIATTAEPMETIKRAKAAGFQAIPTGLAHGTITVKSETQTFEVTTLRRDVSTDGRRATVAFTANFAEDAARRDFTFNALYADLDGNLTDFHNGAEDLINGRIRFIGDADTRLTEDTLRVLRFFRFFGRFGRQQPDAATLAVLQKHVPLVVNLSAERISGELCKMVAHLNMNTWNMMADHGLWEILNLRRQPTVLPMHPLSAPAPKGVALIPLAANATALNNNPRLTLSRHAQTFIRKSFELDAFLAKTPDPDWRAVIYRYGHTVVEATLLKHNKTTDAQTILGLKTPIFPINGQDVINAGIASGSQVGNILKIIESWWIRNNYPDRDTCLAQLTLLIALEH